jgi:hypothetical protein
MAQTSVSTTSLTDLLRQRKKFLLNEWFRRMLEDYAEETASFLRKEQDRFANPVAHAFSEAMEAIYRALVDGCDVNYEALEYAIKIKALQGQDPSRGVAFIHQLKDVVRQMPAGSVTEKEFGELENRIDRIAAAALDMFMANRAKIAELAGKLQNRRPAGTGLLNRL